MDETTPLYNFITHPKTVGDVPRLAVFFLYCLNPSNEGWIIWCGAEHLGMILPYDMPRYADSASGN